MHTFVQATGELFDPEMHCLGVGYSGHGLGKNNPAMQDRHDSGPIPCGRFLIGEPFDSPDHGPFCLRLTPLPGNQMFGRAGFLMHGDAIKAPGTASKGCIVEPRSAREAVAQSDDKFLDVVSYLPVADLDSEISGAGG